MTQKIPLGFIRVLYLLVYLFRKAKPNIFFVNSRDKTREGQFYDKNAHDFLQRLHKDADIIETNQVSPWKYLYPASLVHPAILFNKLQYLFYRESDYTPLLKKINEGLGLSWNNKRINRLMNNFKSDRLFYSFLFRFKKVKRVYITQNDTQKGLFCAARENGVETIEFQHGIIDQGHILYNYPAGITSRSPVYVPDLLLTFSTFWGQDINYPVREIIPMGNSIFANNDLLPENQGSPRKSIGFISADVFGMKLKELAREYAATHKNDVILFKLHPFEYVRKKEYAAYFTGFENIRIVTNDLPTEDLILRCNAIVLIQSTVAYQALQAGIPLFIYRQMTYYRHAHIFNFPNVRLIDHASEIIPPDKIIRNSSNIFFDGFNETVYHRLSNFS